jgi:hypothetical protein
VEEKPASKKARAAAVLVLSLTPRLLSAHVVPMEPLEEVRASPNIVVAAVESRQSRWNPQHTLILTDYTLRIEDRLRGQAPDWLTLTTLGGTLGSSTDETCLSVDLRPGARYLLFLGRVDRPYIPITGAAQGVLRETDDGRIAAGESRIPLKIRGRDIRFADFVEAVRSLAAEAETQPVSEELPELPENTVPLPAKRYDPSSVPAPSVSFAPLAAPAFAPPPLPDGTFETDLALPPPASGKRLRPLVAPFHYETLAPAPIVVNPLGPDSGLSPWDQYQMAYWNVYGGDLFRVAPAHSTWAYHNGVFDIAGFPDDAQMKQQFGYTWDEIGKSVLGVTFVHDENGVRTEADVALNPHRSWTADDAEGTVKSGPYPFNQVMLHELGHVWGLDHGWEFQPVSWDSVMNYKFHEFELDTLFADDTAAVRAAHPGVAIVDGLVSSYTTRRVSTNIVPEYDPTYPVPSTVRRGGSFKLAGPIKIENVGTAPFSKATVEVYLAPRRMTFDGAIRIRTIRVQGTVKPSATQALTLSKLTVPANVPPGTYYIAFYLRQAKDAYANNNGAWTNFDRTLTVTN